MEHFRQGHIMHMGADRKEKRMWVAFRGQQVTEAGDSRVSMALGGLMGRGKVRCDVEKGPGSAGRRRCQGRALGLILMDTVRCTQNRVFLGFDCPGRGTQSGPSLNLLMCLSLLFSFSYVNIYWVTSSDRLGTV